MPIHAIDRAFEGIPGKPASRPIYAGVLTAIALLMLPSLLSGCQFKNRNVIELSGYDTIKGYYSTQPQSIVFSRKLTGEENARSQKSPVNLIPEFLRYVMSDPTILSFDYPLDGVGSIRSKHDYDIGFATHIQEKEGKFGASGQSSVSLIGCTLTESISHEGEFTQNPNRNPDTGVRGKLSLTYTVSYRLTGDETDCAPIRLRFARCYRDGIDCSETSGSVYSLAVLSSIFDPVIQAGIMTPGEIEQFEEVGYVAQYR